MSLALGIDVGGTKVLGGVVDSSGKIVRAHGGRLHLKAAKL